MCSQISADIQHEVPFKHSTMHNNTLSKQTLWVKFQRQQMCSANMQWYVEIVSFMALLLHFTSPHSTNSHSKQDTQRVANVWRKGKLNNYVKTINIDVRNSSLVTTVNHEVHGQGIGDRYTTPSYVIMAWCSVKHRDNFKLVYNYLQKQSYVGNSSSFTIVN
jgi:hypothetical protein